MCRADANVEVTTWRLDQRAQIVSSCVQNITAVSSIQNQIREIIEQHTQAGKKAGKNKGALWGIVIGVLVLLLVEVVVFLGDSAPAGRGGEGSGCLETGCSWWLA